MAFFFSGSFPAGLFYDCYGPFINLSCGCYDSYALSSGEIYLPHPPKPQLRRDLLAALGNWILLEG